MHFSVRSAVGLGVITFFCAILPGGVWTGLLIANLRTSPNIPWCVIVMALLLWAIWRYLDGRGPPMSTSEARHQLLRAVPVSPAVFLPRRCWRCSRSPRAGRILDRFGPTGKIAAARFAGFLEVSLDHGS